VTTSRAYLDEVIGQLERIRDEQDEGIGIAAGRCADSVEAGGLVHVFGSGHSSMVAQDLFGRAGGFTNVNWIYADDLTAVRGLRSGTVERVSGIAEALLDHEPVREGDVLIVISQSGRNAVPVEMAEVGAARGLWVVAITSLEHSRSVESRAPSGRRLFEVADLVIDNLGAPGDARMGLPFGDEVIAVGPTSTVIGTAIAQAIATEAAAQLVARGIRPPLFQSGNQDGSGRSNDDELRRTAPRTPSLLAADVSRLASSDD
jgi:uncharacterized phosphosugar-binding protein